MTLVFPNKTKNFKSNMGTVGFTGYDGLMMIEFSISIYTLEKLDKSLVGAEKNYLNMFDASRVKIEKAAVKAYSKGKKSKYDLGLEFF